MTKREVIHLLTSYKDLISVFVIALLLGCVVLTMQLNKDRQNFSSQAFTKGVKLSVISPKTMVSIGEKIAVEFKIDTNGLDVTAADLHLIYPAEIFELESFSIPANALLPNILGPQSVNPSVNSIADTSTPGKVLIQLGSGISAKRGVATLAVMLLRAKNSSQNAKVSYASTTKVAAISYDASVVESTSSLSFVVGNTFPPATSSISLPNNASNVSVLISQPLDGVTVPQTGFVPVVATAQSSTSITKIEVFLNSTLIYTCPNTNTCSYNIRAKRLARELNIIKVIAADSQGYSATASTKIVAQ